MGSDFFFNAFINFIGKEEIDIKKITVDLLEQYRDYIIKVREQKVKILVESGYYNPYKESSEVKIDADACKKWLANGAKPTETVSKLLKVTGITK